MTTGCDDEGVTEITKGWGSIKIESDCSAFRLANDSSFLAAVICIPLALIAIFASLWCICKKSD